jgi:hypothetical protein
MKVQFATFITSTPDTNGNARRAYIINEVDESEARPYPYIIDVIDEYFQGSEVVTKQYPNCRMPGYNIDVTPKVYNQYIKIGEAKRKGRVAI